MEYVTITKAAKLLRISRPTLYKLIASGKVKTRIIAGRPVIAVTQLNGSGRPRTKGSR